MAGAATFCHQIFFTSPLSHNAETWYKLLDHKVLTSARKIFPEFVNFMGGNPDVVALASIAFYALSSCFLTP